MRVKKVQKSFVYSTTKSRPGTVPLDNYIVSVKVRKTPDGTRGNEFQLRKGFRVPDNLLSYRIEIVGQNVSAADGKK